MNTTIKKLPVFPPKIIKIVEYEKVHQVGIDEMMIKLSSEFERNIFSKNSLQTPLIPDIYWIALVDDNVIGTVGLSFKGDYAVLKKMFLKKTFRGEKIGVSNKLLKVAIAYCLDAKIFNIYLGTMIQFKAAQSFYKKNGFHQVLECELPNGFMLNPLDSVFFKKSTRH
jgi:N-acetylglutamate synthase-like GNAT family acetyltransferase